MALMDDLVFKYVKMCKFYFIKIWDAENEIIFTLESTLKELMLTATHCCDQIEEIPWKSY